MPVKKKIIERIVKNKIIEKKKKKKYIVFIYILLTLAKVTDSADT